jgi:2-polyprenyl-6-methoxyphenol hydroxylase-like FAD-dependent oxidoreductase
MLIDNKRIAIVGGGPGGLTLARLLQMKGADVKVYERDVNRQGRVQGATLDLHEESGLAALEAAGLMPAFLENYRPGAGKLRVLDKYATIKLDGHDQQDIEERRPEIDRGPLRNMLLDSLQPDTVIWDSQFETMNPQGDGWQLEFRNGTSAYADIVIGADGANSRIRSFITPIKPFYSGITVVEGAVYNSETASPRIHELLKGGKIFAFGDSKSLIVSSKGDGSMAFYTGSWVPEDWAATSGVDFKNKEQVIEWFKKDFAGWDDVWTELFENAEPYFMLRPQYCMPLDQSWDALPNLIMLGDAAHLMPPYAGEGVNMAMLDSLELSQCLTEGDFKTIHEAIAHYETNMRKRASETAQATLDSTEMLHCKDSADRLIAMFNSFDEHQ